MNTIYRQFDDSAVGDSDQYFKHVDAMTREDLHSKAEIALELASRDLEIESLRAQLKSTTDRCQKIVDWFDSQLGSPSKGGDCERD